MMEALVCIGGHAGDPAETGRIRARLRTREDMVQRLKQKADSICLTAEGVVPLDLACPSSWEALLGPAGSAYQHNGIVVATDGSLKRCGSMGASFLAKDGRLPARSVAVLGQPSSIRKDFPLSLYRHSVRQLLLHVVKLVNKRAVA
jgi:hypothetical protein